MNTLSSTRSLPAFALLAASAVVAGPLLHDRPTAGSEARDGAHELSRAFRDVAHAISPSVVGVLSIHEREQPTGKFHQLSPLDESIPEPFRRFFGDGFLGDDQRLVPPPVL